VVIAYHIMFTGYAQWLPNDPRGSMSEELRSPEIQRLGEVHLGRRDVQPTQDQLKAFYREAEQHLAHPVLWFEREHRDTIGRAFGTVIADERLTCYACAVLQNHVHVLIRKHRLKAEGIAHRLKTVSCDAMRTLSNVPDVHPVWAQRTDTRYKDTTERVWICVDYINDNFRKHRIEVQEWDFVTPYDDWPLHKR